MNEIHCTTHEAENVIWEGCDGRIQSDHFKVAPEFDLSVYNYKEDIQAPGIVTALRVVTECWQARAIGLERFAETLIPCWKIVLVSASRGVINGECAAAWEEMFRM